MSEAPEYVFCDEYATEIDTAKSGRCHLMYRRADLPATDAQALANPKVQALVKCLNSNQTAWLNVKDLELLPARHQDTLEEIIGANCAALAQLKKGQNDVSGN